MGKITSVSDEGLTFSTGQVLKDIDTILYCTGYLFSFPFCQSTDEPWSKHPLTVPPPTLNKLVESSDSIMSSSGLRVHNLDEYSLFYVPDPTVMISCLAMQVIPFRKYACLTNLIIAVLAQTHARVAATKVKLICVDFSNRTIVVKG